MSEVVGDGSAGLGGSGLGVVLVVLGISVFLSASGLGAGVVVVGEVVGAGLAVSGNSSLTGMMTIFLPSLMQTNGVNGPSIWISLRLNLSAVIKYSDRKSTRLNSSHL